MDVIVQWFANGIGQYVPAELVVFIISLMPLLECRGGLIAASLLQVPLLRAIPICVIGNIIPIPFILLFIKKIFHWMRRFKIFRPLVDKLEARAMKKSGSVSNAEFMGLLLFVGVPLPGTGAWMGSLVAALLEMDTKKAVVAELLGVAMATTIISILFYGLLGAVMH
ncbi:MAG: small multi-drug export protein [Lachnospiraceae bacterium]|jgi:uncharacterized membrane protein|nr:small multi-drug export protein [Lachnospiraceae bacterium]MDD7702871.1 small multi-drug export protein [Lachnospiraceae bacterium]MDY3300941.1 small multi-drug export protein [Lachnospiraceae bacterium]MEE3379164.1 small multi-drug export protein [Lachnospiraceae bacterium]MEE3433155.1 small multi-drug export protein [Lachnospiraceae bacterium]